MVHPVLQDKIFCFDKRIKHPYIRPLDEAQVLPLALMEFAHSRLISHAASSGS